MAARRPHRGRPRAAHAAGRAAASDCMHARARPGRGRSGGAGRRQKAAKRKRPGAKRTHMTGISPPARLRCTASAAFAGAAARPLRRAPASRDPWQSATF